MQVFSRNGETWTLDQTIGPSDDASGGDGFGFSAVLRADTLLIGAPLEDTGVLSSGAAYVYNWEGTSWKLGQLLKAPVPQAESHFGTMSSMDDDTIAISAWHEAVDGNSWAGAVYTYRRGASGWVPEERLLAPTTRAFAMFGAAVTVRGDLLIVSAPHNPPETSSNRSGEVHVYKRDGVEYRTLQTLEAPQPSVGDRFGNHVGLTTSSLVVGAPGSDAARGGAAYLYARTGDAFVRSANISASNGDAEDSFGYAVAMTDAFVAIAALHEDGGAHGINGNGADNTTEDSGAVYVFE